MVWSGAQAGLQPHQTWLYSIGFKEFIIARGISLCLALTSMTSESLAIKEQKQIILSKSASLGCTQNKESASPEQPRGA